MFKNAIARLECMLCWEEFPKKKIAKVDCKHKICKECLQEYLDDKITDGQILDGELLCPHPKCREEFTAAQVRRYAGSAAYRRFRDQRARICHSCHEPKHPGSTCAQFEEVCFGGGQILEEMFIFLRENLMEMVCENSTNFVLRVYRYRKWKLKNSAGDSKFDSAARRNGWVARMVVIFRIAVKSSKNRHQQLFSSQIAILNFCGFGGAVPSLQDYV